MSKPKAKIKKRVRPDDHFVAGPFEFARFGKLTVAKSHLTQADLDEARKEMADRFPAMVAEINALVASIVSRIVRLPPARMLHRAWWEFANMSLGVGDKKADATEQLVAMRMIDYVQSVIASATPETYVDEVSDEDWNTLRADIATLFTMLSLEYQMFLTAYRMVQDPGLDMDLEEFRMQAETMWLNVRGKRYQVHEHEALLELLAPHSDVIERQFGIGAEELVHQFDKILAALARGIADLMRDLIVFREETLARMEMLASHDATLDRDALRDKTFEDEKLATQREKIGGEKAVLAGCGVQAGWSS